MPVAQLEQRNDVRMKKVNNRHLRKQCDEQVRGAKCAKRLFWNTSFCLKHFVGNQLFKTPNIIGAFLFSLIVGPALSGPILSRFSGAQVFVEIGGLHSLAGNTKGCTIYSVSLRSTGEMVERINLEVNFPGEIVSSKFGALNMSRNLKNEKNGLTAFEIGRNVNGECEVLQAATATSPNLISTLAGARMVTFSGSSVPTETNVCGMYVLSKHYLKQPSDNVFATGTYEYIKYGKTIRKPINIVINPVIDATSKK